MTHSKDRVTRAHFDRNGYEVRVYQLEGAFFLASQVVALLGDEPGIGKTFQALMAMEVAQCRRTLILCPAIARYHWLRQCESYLSSERQFSILWAGNKKPPTTDGIICSYDAAIRTSVSTFLCSAQWDVIIADECHALNNPSSQRASLVWSKLTRRTRHLWCLSGTPARNNVSELWPILNAAGQWTKGRDRYIAHYCDVVHTVYGEKIVGTKKDKVQEIRRLLEPVMLRRHVKDVMSQLPALTHSIYPIEPTTVDIQRWYSKVTIGLMTKEELYRKIADEIRATEALLDVSESPDQSALALSALQTSTTLSRRYTGLSKVPAISELIRTELLDGHYQKIVLFCWHRDVIEFLKFNLREFGPVVIFGGQLVTTTDANIHHFQNRPAVRVCIAQIAAAGVAIDLTAASEVGFVESSYVPADNAQAVMRVHRFPQKRPVRSRFFITPDSVDERVTLILRKKTADLTRLFGAADSTPQPITNPFQ